MHIETRVQSAWSMQRLQLKYDKLLSSVAFSFNLRPYSMGLKGGCVGVLSDPEEAAGKTRRALAAYESALDPGGGAFLCGEAPGAADCQLGPVLVCFLNLLQAAGLAAWPYFNRSLFSMLHF